MPSRGEVAHDLEHLPDELRVERGGRLVEQHHVGVHRQRTRDRDPLLLTARQVRRVGVDLLEQADALEVAPRDLDGLLLRCDRRTRCWAIVRLRSTERCGKRLNDWKTMPIRLRRRSTSASGVEDVLALDEDGPSDASSSRFTQRSSVDFPEPDGPMTQTTSPCATWKSMPRSTWLSPKDLCSPDLDRQALAAPSSPRLSRARCGARAPRRAG
jgi:hypothetical protein